MEESSLPGMGGSDDVSELDLPSSTNDVRGIGSSKLTSGGVDVPASFRATADFAPGKFPNNEPTISSLMVSTDRFTASVIFFVVGDSDNVASNCFAAPVPVVGGDVVDWPIGWRCSYNLAAFSIAEPASTACLCCRWRSRISNGRLLN